jgi:hypothetical protein
VRRTHCSSLSKQLRIPCLIVAAICSLAGDDLPGPPVRGRPVGFSGIEGAVDVTATAAPVALMAESPLTYTLRLKGPPTLATLPVPELAKLNRFHERFAIRLLGQSWLPKEQTREFQFELRPRSANVDAIPPFSFSFWLRGKVPPEAGFETRSTKSIALRVSPRPDVPVRSLSIEGAPDGTPAWEPDFDFSIEGLRTQPTLPNLPYSILTVIAVIPPLVVLLRTLGRRSRRTEPGRGCVRVLELARRICKFNPADPAPGPRIKELLDAEARTRFESVSSRHHPEGCGCSGFLAVCQAYQYGGAQQESLLRLIDEARTLIARREGVAP